MSDTGSGLYGISNSNRSRDNHWGKNCFNSSFPAAMAAYMFDKKIPAIYIKLANINGKLETVADEIQIPHVFNSGDRCLSDLNFAFESVYDPYSQLVMDRLDCIDLVIKDSTDGYLSPLEVKLTVLPDSTTVNKNENLWGCEMVIRAATTSYCALGMFQTVAQQSRTIRQIFEPSCSDIQMWDNDFEMSAKTRRLANAIDVFERENLVHQKPLLLQTIWKTQGQSPILAKDAFDIVVWSDYAFTRLFVDSALQEKSPKKMSRPMRSTARLARCLWELSKSGKIRLTDIYRQMAFGVQTDKEFAIAGTKWRTYVNSPRLLKPILPSSAVLDIIEPGFIERLKPERRFDQTLYFTARNIRDN